MLWGCDLCRKKIQNHSANKSRSVTQIFELSNYRENKNYEPDFQSADGEVVGFVGLGNMGAHMARNLVKKGYPVLVYDLNQDSVNSLKEAGQSVQELVPRPPLNKKSFPVFFGFFSI